MHEALLDLLRCPFCGTRVAIVEEVPPARTVDGIGSALLGCECCAFPVVAGIPVMLADDPTRDAIKALEAGRHEEALFRLLGLDAPGVAAFRRVVEPGSGATYRDALAILCRDEEATYFVHRFSDPTFIVAEAILEALARQGPLAGRALDLCGGAGHLTRVLAGLQALQTPTAPIRPGPVVADLFFWKLWLAARFTAPGSAPVCCDANQPLPFARGSFRLVLLSDAFPYIWHKRLLAEEMMRQAAPDGVIVLPHLHSALGENFSAGNTLTPSAYQELFADRQPRLFSDARLLAQVLERRLDLADSVAPAALGTEPSLTLVASSRADLFRAYELAPAAEVSGRLCVNPLYRIERRGGSSILTLTFPTPEYEEEFGACRQYLPDTVTVEADLTGVIEPAALGSRYEELRRRRIVIDVPARF
jgi:uncharacterized protein YbaR (Trm112 family)